MVNRKTQVLNILILVYAFMRALNHFYKSTLLQAISAGFLLVVMIGSMPKLKKATRFVVLALIVAGSALLIYKRADAVSWLTALLSNGNFVMMLVLASMISAPFYYEDYQGELKTLAQLRMSNLLSFLLLLSVTTHFLAVMITVGAMLLNYELLQPFAKLYKAEVPYLKTLSRSYSSSGFWSPVWGSVIVFTAYPDVNWIACIPIGIGLAVVMNIVNLFSVWLEMKRFPGRYPAAVAEPGAAVNNRLIVKLLIVVFALIGTIVLLSHFTGWDLMLIVAITATLFPPLVALIQRKVPQYKKEMTRYWNVQLPKASTQAAMFLFAGFLGRSLSISGIGDLLVNLLPDWLISLPALMCGAIMLMLVIPAILGMHPVAIGTAMVNALVPASLGLTNLTFALTILTGWLIAIMMAPFSATALLLSSYNGRSSYYNSVGINWRFSIVCIVVFSLLISWAGPLLS